MAPPDTELPRLLILPQNRSPESRICTLAHPRTSTPSRYYFDPEKGIYEFTKIAAHKSVYRSCLLTDRIHLLHDEADQKTEGPVALSSSQMQEKPISAGYVLKNAEVLVATPIDELFLLLPSLHDSVSAKSSSKGLFLSAEDLIEKLAVDSKHLNHISKHEARRKEMEGRVQAVCDFVDAGDEKMYRLNNNKLLEQLVRKAKNMVGIGLPASMEEKFVRKALETPVMVLKREESSLSEANEFQGSVTVPLVLTPSDTAESQGSIATSVSTVSAGTELTVPDDPISPSDDTHICHLLRMRTALAYMISAYIPPLLATTLTTMLSSDKSPIDFTALDARLARLAKTRAENLAARSLGDFSRKRSMYEEDDAAETRLEKKKRMEEEEKKKKMGETRGIRNLKKVDTKGMKKMSDFFGKGSTTKKK